MKQCYIYILGLLLFLNQAQSQDKENKEKEEGFKTEILGDIFNNSKKEIPLDAMIEAIGKIGPPEFQNKNILYETGISKSTTFNIVKGPVKVNKDDPYFEFHMIEELLAINGYLIVANGPFLMVVKSTKAMTYDVRLYGDSDTGSVMEMTAKIVNTTHVPANEIVRALTPFVDKTTNNVSFLQLPSTDGIMILGPKRSLEFITPLVEMLDVPGDMTKVELLKVDYVLPKNIASQVKELRSNPIRKTGNNTPQPVIIPDDRTMQIIVKATKDQLTEIKDLIKMLDQPMQNPEQNRDIRFYKLKNAKAEEVANTLNNLYSRIKQQLPQGNAQGAAAVVQSTGKTRDDVPTIVPEKNINALLIIGADKEEFDYMLEIIGELDKRRDQVMIIGTIVEMSDSKAWELAVELAAINAGRINESGKPNPFVNTSFGASALNIDSDNPGKVPNLGPSFLTGFTYGSQEALPFILKATQSDNEVNSLAQPSIMANDNQQASVTIDSSVPYETASTGTNQVTNTNVEFAKAPITLQIKPTINAPDRVDAEKYIILEVNVNVTTFDFSTISAGGTPGQNSRQAQTVVTVPDRGVVVVGGLTGFSYDRGESKVPILGDIPLLGNLFKSQNRLRSKRNIYIFISPQIMTNFREAESYARDTGATFDVDKQFYGELKKRIWSNTQLMGRSLTDSSFYPSNLLPED